MSFFEKFTVALKHKWLDYFQSNRSWIILQMKVAAVKTPDGGQRPPSYLILGAVSALEQKLANLMVPFYQLNTDPDKLIEVLGLNFDPERELAKRSEQAVQNPEMENIPLLPDSEEP